LAAASRGCATRLARVRTAINPWRRSASGVRLRGRSPVPPSISLLVVGLGNPGREHSRDRHNVGWMVIDELARRYEGTFKSKFSGRLSEMRIAGERVALLKPETYMNDSGRSVAAASAFFKVQPETIVVVHDEVDLATGRLQLRAGGGLAGHNGLRSVAAALGSHDFLRVRVGVGRPERGDLRPVADYVLSAFDAADEADAIVTRSSDAVEAVVADGLESAQQLFNDR
jgi:peptidyl-tRNA hydrolase, PTH1 family